MTGRELAARERLPADYVEQILLRLRRADVVRSTRGAHGGYVLARPADRVSVRDVIAASELGTFDLHCVTHPVDEERCSASHHCSIRPVWMLLQQKIDDVLEGVHLADLLAEESVVRERVGLERVGHRARGSSGPPGVDHQTTRIASSGAGVGRGDMRMGLWGRWAAERAGREQASAFVRALLVDPPESDVQQPGRDRRARRRGSRAVGASLRPAGGRDAGRAARRPR